MIEAEAFAKLALSEKWNKYKYSQLDCQGFVEAVLKELGIRKKDGTCYNWTGSNSMYRNYYSWRGTLAECIAKFGEVPTGAFVYMWQSSGEQERGYTDGLGNAKHVGIYCGNNIVRDSTRSTKTGRDGVGTRSLTGFNMVTLFSGLDYNLSTDYTQPVDNLKSSLVDNLRVSIDNIQNELKRMEVLLNEHEHNN